MIATTIQLRALVRESKIDPWFQLTSKYHGTKKDPKKRIFKFSCPKNKVEVIEKLMDEHQYTNKMWISGLGPFYVNFETQLPD